VAHKHQKFVKEVCPPNAERRKVLLSKIYKLKGVSSKETAGPKNLLRMLREQLALCDGRTLYYYQHKQHRFYIGDESVPKKNFLLYKDVKFIQPIIGNLRRKPAPLPLIKNVYISSIDARLNYEKDGLVRTRPNMFGELNNQITKKQVTRYKAPSTADSYIGVELEVASQLSRDELVPAFIEAGLKYETCLKTDSSIRTNSWFPNQVEICLLFKINEMEEVFSKFKKILDKKLFEVNESCGLHVHLDMRNRDVLKAFANLSAMQMVLFGLADDSRRENSYCRPVHHVNMYDNPCDHYAAISRYSYERHRTIEIRIHHATLDLTKIKKWIKLLSTIANYSSNDLRMGSMDFELSQLKEKIKPEPEIWEYVEKEIKVGIPIIRPQPVDPYSGNMFIQTGNLMNFDYSAPPRSSSGFASRARSQQEAAAQQAAAAGRTQQQAIQSGVGSGAFGRSMNDVYRQYSTLLNNSIIVDDSE
jgi:hypothetical protein